MSNKTVNDSGAGSVRSLLIPVHGKSLVVPNVAVAEVIPRQATTPVGKAPAWLLGAIGWRGMTIPVISYEASRGDAILPPDAESQLAIINTVKAGGVPFYALLTRGIPRLRTVDDESLQENDADRNIRQGELCRATLDGAPVVVPDLEGLENLISRYWQKAA